MKTARRDTESAEPILLTESSLEQLLDAFLPEDPEQVAAVGVKRAHAAESPADLFASESLEDQAGDALSLVPLPPGDGVSPWRSYAAPAVSAGTSLRAKESPPRNAFRVPGWVKRGAAAVVVAAVAAISLRQLGTAPSAPAVERPPVQATSTGNPEPPAASRVVVDRPTASTAPTIATAAHDAQPAVSNAVVAGPVLKGSLTPDRAPAARPDPSAAPRAVRAVALPDGPVATAAAIPSPPPAAAPVPPAPPTFAAVVPIAEPTPVVPSPEPPPPAAAAVAPAPRAEAPVAAVPPPAAVAAPVPPADTARIQGVLGRYRTAFTALDADAARAIWPTVDSRALGRAFDQLKEQELEFQTCNIVVNGLRATAVCDGRARYVPKVGTKSLRDEHRHWTFSLRRVEDSWLIESVASR